MFKINDLGCLLAIAVRVWSAAHTKPAHNQVKGLLVGLHQLGRTDPFQGADDLTEPVLIQLGISFIIQVDLFQGLAQPIFEQDLTERLSFREIGHIDISFNMPPSLSIAQWTGFPHRSFHRVNLPYRPHSFQNEDIFFTFYWFNVKKNLLTLHEKPWM